MRHDVFHWVLRIPSTHFAYAPNRSVDVMLVTNDVVRIIVGTISRAADNQLDQSSLLSCIAAAAAWRAMLIQIQTG